MDCLWAFKGVDRQERVWFANSSGTETKTEVLMMTRECRYIDN